jgi:hypothetical protein
MMQIDDAFEIDNTSPEERKELFLRYFGIREFNRSERDTLPIHMTRRWIQNPYESKSWPMRKELSKMSLEKPAKLFTQRYSITYMVKMGSSSITQPDLWRVESTTDYYKKILYNDNGLFMKVVPLINNARSCERSKDEYDCQYKSKVGLDEIYNEIIVAFFLNELIYGYKNVLSIHFMTIVDWFIAPRFFFDQRLINDASMNVVGKYMCQFSISEKMDFTFKKMCEILEGNNVYTEEIKTRVMRAMIFQVFHALEIAWYTNRYIHNDLHLENVMFQEISDLSRLAEKDLLYRRPGLPDWYIVPSDDLYSGIMKIIDFGRSRMFVPSKPHSNNKYSHDRLIALENFRLKNGYTLNTENRGVDVHVFLKALYKQTKLHSVKEMIARVLPNHEKDAYKYRPNAPTASDVLNDYFFKPYNAKKILSSSTTKEDVSKVVKNAIVVSFITEDETNELSLSSSSTSIRTRCSVCRQQLPLKYYTGNNDFFCGESCYEFRYLFKEKTVYR